MEKSFSKHIHCMSSELVGHRFYLAFLAEHLSEDFVCLLHLGLAPLDYLQKLWKLRVVLSLKQNCKIKASQVWPGHMLLGHSFSQTVCCFF